MKTAFAAFFVILSSILITACGDSGGGNESSSDTTPNTFSFTAETDAALSTEFSDTVTITGIDAATSISITGGEYSLDGGTTFTSDEGTVTNNQDVVVRATSAATVSTDVEVVLTVGGVTGTFTITTFADRTPPTVEIAFPPPASMTEGTEVLVRGTATDDYSDIATLQVNGVDVTDTSDDGSYSTWQIRAALTAGENTLTVTGSDSAENEIAVGDQPSVAVRSDATMGDFPDSNNVLSSPQSLEVDLENNRILVGDNDLDTLFTIDLSTGGRETLSDNSIEDLTYPFTNLDGLLLDETNNRVLVADEGLARAIFSVDLTSGVRSVVSNADVPAGNPPLTIANHFQMVFDPNDSNSIFVIDASTFLIHVDLTTGERETFSTHIGMGVPNDENAFAEPRGIALDLARNRLLVSDYFIQGSAAGGVIAVSLVDGARTYISSDTIPNNEPPFLTLAEVSVITMDLERNRALISDTGAVSILAVEIGGDSEGARSVFSSPTVPDVINAPVRTEEVFYQEGMGYALWTDLTLDAVLAVDIESGERVFVTRGDSPE